MSPTPDSAAVDRRRFAWLTGAALAVILLFAARARFMWPGMPVADPDTWGYLHPALAKLTGQGFIHTNGRNFVYPGWIYLLLASTGSFRAIPFAQHVLGLASGLLMWVCWRQWRAWFTDPRLPLWADATLGLGLVAFFELSASAIHFEHQIRPEAIFPFFALLDLVLLLAFLRQWFVTRQPTRAAALAGGGLFVAGLLYQLKPSFGLALGAAAAPVLLAALAPWRQPQGPRWHLAGAAALAAAAAGVLFVWPEHRLSQGDAMSTLFLPETLLTIHADLINEQMAADVRDHAATPYAPDWLVQAHEALATELRSAAEPASNLYPTLGFNPDYLMYNHHSYCVWLYARLYPPQTATFAYYYYRRVWIHRPWQMLAKVCRQLRVFYSLHCAAFWSGPVLKIDKLYRKSIAAFDYPYYQRELVLYPPAREYLDAARTLGGSGLLFPQPTLMLNANKAASFSALPLLLAFGATMAAVGLARTRRLAAPAGIRLLIPGWVLLLFHGFLFGNCLTIAVVHSLDVERYSLNLLVFCALAEAATIAWLAEFALAIGTSRRRSS